MGAMAYALEVPTVWVRASRSAWQGWTGEEAAQREGDT